MAVQYEVCVWLTHAPSRISPSLTWDLWWINLRIIYFIHWGDPDADGRIILRRIFRKWEGVVRTGWSWVRIGTGGGHL